MTSLLPTPAQGLHRLACSLCARRKVRCDKGEPCANCLKAQAQCLYEVPAPHRPRKRAADEDQLARLALYEDLMRKHSIDFTRYANTWVPSGLEVKLRENDSQNSVSVVSMTSRPSSKTCPSQNTAANVFMVESELRGALFCDSLWGLKTEISVRGKLKYPLIQSLRHKDDPLLHPTPPLQFIFPSNQPELHALHPEPRHTYRFWQIFVESVNPLMKIVHVPTLQQRISDACWDPADISKPLTAILFAIYTLAVTSMSSDDCQATFGEIRTTLLMRYRAATVRALVAADFLTTREFEVLQAFVLFLHADPESELTFALTGAAVKLGYKMGLNRENTDPKISLFEKEMRIRVWWQLRGLDARGRGVSTPGMKPWPSEFGDVRLPLNINDADLHPNMIESPIEHNNPTEMLCVLVKFESFNWFRSSPTSAKVFENIIQGPVRGEISVELEDGVINELEAIYHEKYFRIWDKSVPLHGLAHAMAKLAIARMRFKVHHPQRRVAVSGGEVYMTREESDMLFDSAVISLEMVDVGIHSKFSSHLFTHMTSKFQIEAYIYVISDLRRRCSGDRVALAWKLVEDLYNEHPELIDDAENTFFVALAELTVEAWEARRKELVYGQGVRESDVTPQFIRLLWDKRQNRKEESIQISIDPDPHSLDGLELTDDNNLDWEYWNDFLPL